MNLFILISLIILILYVLKIQKYKYNWEHYPEIKLQAKNTCTKISVVIAFRNEINNLPDLLKSLKCQSYPADLFEVILVNDHSIDGSEELVENFCKTTPAFRLLNCEGYGKKPAIFMGIKNAVHELIVTTDADCTMEEDWLAMLTFFYTVKNPEMIIGLLDMHAENGFFKKFQELEFLSIIAAGAGAAAGDSPIYCNAACLAYKKSLFIAYDDPLKNSVTSGDDTLFMLEVKKDRKGPILLLKASSAIVATKGAATWREFYNQRKRWVSKSRHYNDFEIIYTGLLVLLVNLSLVYSIALFVLGQNFWLLPLIYSGKTISDTMFMKRFLDFYHKKLTIDYFLIYELIYPFYAILFAVTGFFSGYSWKGRDYKPTG